MKRLLVIDGNGTVLNFPIDPKTLDTNSPVPLYEQLARELRRLIAAGELKAGEQLPSVSTMAKHLNLSASTVRQALAQLTSDGWLSSQQGSRSKVALKQPVLERSSLRNRNGSVDKSVDGPQALRLEIPAVDPLPEGVRISAWASRMQAAFIKTPFYARYDEPVEIDFRAGHPAAESLSGSSWQTALARWSSHCIEVPRGHNNPSGILDLRKQIAKWINQQRNIECNEENIFVVSGAQQARDLICRLLVDETKLVIFEEPGSLFAKLSFQSYGARLLPVSVDGSGIVASELTDAAMPRADLLYLTPSAQFPTGSVLSRARRMQISEWAKERNVVIIEDDNYCEFTYESRQSPALFSFAPDQCIYIGTFSQLLEPSWRLAFLIVPDRIRDALHRTKWLSDRCSSPLVQTLILELMESGFLKRHLKKEQAVCEQRRLKLLQEIESLPKSLVQFTPTKGGLNQALFLHSSMNDLAIFADCFEQGVGVLPISPNFMRSPAPPGILLSFAAVPEDKIGDGIARLRRVLEKAHGA